MIVSMGREIYHQDDELEDGNRNKALNVCSEKKFQADKRML